MITSAIQLAWPDEGINIEVDGRLARIELTKKSLLDLGVAVLADVEGQEPWIGQFSYQLAADPAQGRGLTRIEGGTTDPIIVCLARRYWTAVNSPNFRPGPVPIPTEEEAINENKKGI